jgi:hypothetical protein
MRTFLRLGLLSAATFLVALAGAKYGKQLVLAFNQTATQPFVAFRAEYENTHFDPRNDSNRHVETGTIHHASDGSTAFLRKTADGERIDVRLIRNNAKAAHYSYAGAIHSFIEYPEAANYTKETCSRGPARTILGFETHFSKRAMGYDVTIERWRAPALDCLALERKVYRKVDAKSEPVLVQHEFVTSVVMGEQDRMLFEPPPGAVNRAPSEFMSELHKQESGGKPVPACNIVAAGNADAAWTTRRTNARERGETPLPKGYVVPTQP